MGINIRKPAEIEKLRLANKIVAGTLSLLRENAKEGISLLELDKIAEDYIRSHGARPSFKGLYGFPNTLCTSLNTVIIHGIPTDYKLKEGDIIGLDVGTELEGYYGDGAITVPIGRVGNQDEALIACAKDSLYAAIDCIRVGMHFKELSHFLEQFILKRGFVPLRSFCGHGIGKKPHEEPEIPNYLNGSNPKQGPKIKEGMVFCIEPMICQKSGDPKILQDKWSVTSVDELNGSHYEHTVAVVGGCAEILTQE
ncbi:type I methionyl aminopeptidase [Helicobacter monodelphidis]|uniref:type I methionyl aminopeptidase n=1 Tax=Helicobacter sp. 15-1451 TaxID=2004995 RepID=UPI000DCB5DC4|nr:type I methionyl aminopeptidase [Helicobacter sp. 15-1451]RAX57122.1 type I methionyl aminopeptidase [Helicobacter sp. 15-1451]